MRKPKEPIKAEGIIYEGYDSDIPLLWWIDADNQCWWDMGLGEEKFPVYVEELLGAAEKDLDNYKKILIAFDKLNNYSVGEKKKFVRKPVIIEAYQTDKVVYIETLEGIMKADIGDWIITGIRGERYPCKPDIFAEIYEEVK